MVATLPKGSVTLEEFPTKSVRRVRVSKQRQISIPKDFYNALHLDDEALVEFTGNEIIIRPAQYEEVDFSGDILKDLLEKGYKDDDLLQEFIRLKSNIPRALDFMKREAMEQPTITGNLDDYLDSLEDDGDDD
ncbi:AbrB/MazE/SpoVT family DNA-binding domain-containing protein [Bacillus toyonensis]|uniref:AbrB/MazE/SpoVT family DNA-binding domain-containing protein n=1 Tax=Bacillus cereus group TaxID=86661 RepID=UPI003D209B84